MKCKKNVMIENLRAICNGGDSGMPQMGEELTEKVISMAMLVFDGTAASITVEIGKSKVKIARSGEKIKTSRVSSRKLETTA
ncbi:unknown [Firmicutes bacterium CAG:238]|nr:unknown [Firmicutes bacterium CAG:238]